MNTKTKTNTQRYLAAACLMTLASLSAVNARAEDATATVPQIVVTYGHLNLGSDAGLSALYRRIGQAATKVCEESFPSSKSLAFEAPKHLCREQSMDRAVAAVHSAGLVKLHFAKTGRSSGSMSIAAANAPAGNATAQPE